MTYYLPIPNQDKWEYMTVGDDKGWLSESEIIVIQEFAKAHIDRLDTKKALACLEVLQKALCHRDSKAVRNRIEVIKEQG